MSSINSKYKKWPLFILGLFFLSFVFLKIRPYFWSKQHIQLKDELLYVLVADTLQHQYKGLGKRKELGKYDGMLFVLKKDDKYPIVMRNMHFPIDIIWLNNGQVVDFAPNAQVEEWGKKESELRRYYPRQQADMVLELRAGWTVEHGLKIGDKARMEL